MSDIAQTAIDKAQARIKIDRWLNEYAEGISNRRAEAVGLAGQAELDAGAVEARFTDAEDLRVEALKAKPEAKPYQIVKRSLTGKSEAKSPKFDLAKALDAAEAEERAKLAQAEAETKIFSASTQPEDASQEETQPEAEEPEREQPEGAGRFRLDEETETPVLSKAAPMDNAKAFARDRLHKDGTLATYYYHGDWWQWNQAV